MVRTSLPLSPALHQRLLMAAQANNQTVTDFIRAVLAKALAAEEQARFDQTYQALKKVRGICKDNITDASASINNTLYGASGAWKGDNEQ